MDCADCLGGSGYTESKTMYCWCFVSAGGVNFDKTANGYIGTSEGCNKQNESTRREEMTNYCTNKILAC